MEKLTEKSKVRLKYAAIATLLYVVYFMIMRLAGLAHIPELRFVNYVIYFFVTYYALYDLVKIRNIKMEYLQGMAFTFSLGVMSFLMFSFFVLIYSLFSPFFMDVIGHEIQSAESMGIWGPAFIVFSEGFGLSSVVSLCMMQYFQAFSSPRQLFFFYGKKYFKEAQEDANSKRLFRSETYPTEF